MTALVSIIIPCFNAAPWLAATLESALGQTGPRCEIIVIDDGSHDDSVAIARGFESRGIRTVAQPNRGASAARNHGLRLATGDFIQFLDADDLLESNKIARQLETLVAAPGCVAAGPWGRFEIDPATAIFSPEDNWRDSDPVDWLVLNFAGRGMMPPVAWLTPRTLIDRAGPWDERLTLNDDGEYFCRVLLASMGVKFNGAARTFYRSNRPGSLSRRRSVAAWRSALLSQELCARHLIAREDSPRTHRGCADLFQRLAFEACPEAPDVVDRALELVRIHGGSPARLGGGRALRLISRVLGWKTARRLQHWRTTS